jgi:hypothetical protein
MVKNSTSVKAFWLSFLISGVAVPWGAISATAQIQDTSTPEVALEGSAVPEANPDSALAAVKIEIPQRRGDNRRDVPQQSIARKPKQIQQQSIELYPNKIKQQRIKQQQPQK